MIGAPKAFEGKRSAPGALRLKALLLVISTGWAAFFVQHIFTGFYRIAVVDITTVSLTMIVLWWATATGEVRRLEIGAHLAIVVSSLGIVGVAMLSGQEQAMATWYLTAVPLFAAYHLGTRAAIGWAVATLVLMAAVYWSGAVIRIEPDYIPDARIWFVGKVVLLCVLLGLSVATRRASDAYLEALRQRETIIRQRAEELAQARDDALEAVRVKNEFVANISHEIRTPLNGVIGMTSVLLETEQGREEREIVQTIQRSSTALLAILNDVLDFSKLEAGAVEPETIPLDLQECVEDVLDLFGKTTAEKGIDLYFLPDRDVPRWIEGDITYLRQILLNLVGNAVKFTESGRVWVTIACEDDNILRFEVHDTGIGIPSEKLEDVFLSFSQVDTSTTRKYGGTGLGLAISRRLVSLMGGDLRVESAQNEGSTFSFTIEAPEVDAPERPHTTLENAALIGKSFAVIGGPDGSRDALVRTLEGIGARPILCSLADNDWQETAALLVFDEQTLGELLKQEERPPAVLLAQPLDGEVRDRALRSGVEAVVFRPVRRHALRNVLQVLITGKRPSEQVPYTTFDPTMGDRIPARILVAEDNPINQRVAVTVLQKLGYSPDVASDGKQVLESLERRQYDVLFMDLQMPGVDGLEAARQIRVRHGDRPWIIALTASVNSAQREDVREAGMNDFVGKPFDVRTLMASIERWAEQSPSSSPDQADLDDPWIGLQAMFRAAPAQLATLIASHRDNASTLINQIAQASVEANREEVRVHSHSLKSSAAQFGSRDVSVIAKSLELCAIDCSAAELVSKIEALVASWESADRRLHAHQRALERQAQNAQSSVPDSAQP